MMYTVYNEGAGRPLMVYAQTNSYDSAVQACDKLAGILVKQNDSSAAMVTDPMGKIVYPVAPVLAPALTVAEAPRPVRRPSP